MAKPQQCREVRDLKDSMRFMEHNLALTTEIIQRLDGTSSLASIAKAEQTISMSTCFSGVGCPEQTRHMCGKVLQHFLEQPCECGPHVFAIECDSQNQCELLTCFAAPDCLFSKVEDFVNPKVRDMLLTHGHTLEFRALQRIFTSNRDIVQLHAPCRCHPKKRASIPGNVTPSWEVYLPLFLIS